MTRSMEVAARASENNPVKPTAACAPGEVFVSFLDESSQLA